MMVMMEKVTIIISDRSESNPYILVEKKYISVSTLVKRR